MDQVQMLAAHRGYHTPPGGRDQLQAEMRFLVLGNIVNQGEERNAQQVARQFSLSYANITALVDNYSISAVQLDLWKDSAGGRFRYAAVLKVAGNYENPQLSGDLGPDMSTPGYKVLTTPDADWGTNCQLLTQCLDQLVAGASSSLFPIFVYLNYRDDNIADVFDELGGPGTLDTLDAVLKSISGPPTSISTAEAVGSTDWADIQTEVSSKVARTSIIAPGDLSVVNDQVQWPSLASAKGKFVFIAQGTATDQVVNLGSSRILHTLWDVGNVTSTSGSLSPVTVDTAFVNVTVGDAYISKAIAQRRITTALGAIMEVPSTIPADQRESSSARTSLSTTDIATFSAAGGHILQTDFLVDQEVDISVGSLFVRESFPKTAFSKGAVVQCNNSTVSSMAQSMGCCVPAVTFKCPSSGFASASLGLPLVLLALLAGMGMFVAF